ncbi:MAG: hypothetical protein GF364_12570 [Candidatus Lokiarchaeota archaeon]|nr:hypothetical protein [Candidatus Lokiarchaeota archaeon]
MLKIPIKDSDKIYDLNPSKIITVGGNYLKKNGTKSSKETENPTNNKPKYPLIIPKLPNCLIGPNQNIIIPEFLSELYLLDVQINFRAELALIIKDKCKNLTEKESMDYIYGYTCINDVTQVNLKEFDRIGWWRGKSLDTFGPIGPNIVLAKHIGDPHNLEIRTKLNDEVKQQSNTKNMIFKIPQILAYISKNLTLYKGDIITTGTPPGSEQLKHGDIVEIKIEEIGKLKNPVLKESYTKIR